MKHFRLWLGVTGLLSSALSLPVFSIDVVSERLRAASDNQLLSEFASQNPDDSYWAAREVFARGERMLPLLLKFEGDRRLYSGGGLGSALSAQIVPREPTGDSIFDAQNNVTIELAALYLLTAIYKGRFDFAQSPYLSDLKLPPAKRKAGVSQELITRCWKAARPWVRKAKKMGLAALRDRKEGPLERAKVAFW